MYVPRGLGIASDLAASCANSFFSYALHPTCWSYTGSQLQQMTELTPPSGAVSAAPAAPAYAYGDSSGVQTWQDVYDQAQAGVGAGTAAAQAANLAQSQSQTEIGTPSCGPADIACYLGSVSGWVWIAGGVGLLALIALKR